MTAARAARELVAGSARPLNETPSVLDAQGLFCWRLLLSWHRLPGSEWETAPLRCGVCDASPARLRCRGDSSLTSAGPYASKTLPCGLSSDQMYFAKVASVQHLCGPVGCSRDSEMLPQYMPPTLRTEQSSDIDKSWSQLLLCFVRDVVLWNVHFLTMAIRACGCQDGRLSRLAPCRWRAWPPCSRLALQMALQGGAICFKRISVFNPLRFGAAFPEHGRLWAVVVEVDELLGSRRGQHGQIPRPG